MWGREINCNLSTTFHHDTLRDFVHRLHGLVFGAFSTPGRKAESFVYVTVGFVAGFSSLASAIGRAFGTRPGANFDVGDSRSRD